MAIDERFFAGCRCLEDLALALALPAIQSDASAQRAAVIARLSKLPPFNPAAVQLLAISAAADSTPEDFERAFRADPAMASDLLTVANSPLYGLRARVDNIRHAIALLGLDTVRALAVTVAMGAYVRTVKARQAVQAVWSHSIATAVIAETIGRVMGEPGPALYTAGLVHDVGRLGMANLQGERYAELLEREYGDTEEALLLETLMFGCAHDDAGAFLAQSWGFPEAICDSTRFHHQQAKGAHLSVEVVRLACGYAGALGFQELNCATRPQIPDVLPVRFSPYGSLEPARLSKKIEQATGAFLAVLGAPRPSPRLEPVKFPDGLIRKVS